VTLNDIKTEITSFIVKAQEETAEVVRTARNHNDHHRAADLYLKLVQAYETLARIEIALTTQPGVDDFTTLIAQANQSTKVVDIEKYQPVEVEPEPEELKPVRLSLGQIRWQVYDKYTNELLYNGRTEESARQWCIDNNCEITTIKYMKTDLKVAAR
jgi:LmbE family N-acetylglucosaminyl deacetylase